MKETSTSQLSAVLSIVEAFREIAPTMEIQRATILLLVAKTPGISSREIQEFTGLSSTAISRNVIGLGSPRRVGVSGLGLIQELDDPHDSRRKLYSLTPKGWAFINRVTGAIR